MQRDRRRPRITYTTRSFHLYLFRFTWLHLTSLFFQLILNGKSCPPRNCEKYLATVGKRHTFPKSTHTMPFISFSVSLVTRDLRWAEFRGLGNKSLTSVFHVGLASRFLARPSGSGTCCIGIMSRRLGSLIPHDDQRDPSNYPSGRRCAPNWSASVG